MDYEIYEVNITYQAKQDSNSIFSYITYELQSFDHAIDLIRCFEKSIERLDVFPHRYSVFEKDPWDKMGIRKMPVQNYIVLYMIDERNKKVLVMMVVYAKRDMGTVLNRIISIKN